jgi:hypothetical protein
MKDFEKLIPAPKAKEFERRLTASTSATVDAMLDKMSELISERTAWATLAKLLLIRASYDSADPELRAAFRECFGEASLPPR